MVSMPSDLVAMMIDNPVRCGGSYVESVWKSEPQVGSESRIGAFLNN